MLQWLRANGCEWGPDALYRIAGAKGHTAVVEWLKANGCPQQPDDDELSELFEGSDLSEESDVAENDEGEEGWCELGVSARHIHNTTGVVLYIQCLCRTAGLCVT